MKILSEYKFHNKKAIRLVYRTKKETKEIGLPICDAFVLEFDAGGEKTAVGLRPDEMVIIIRVLSDALFKGIENYDIGVLRGYNGFSK